MTSRETRLSWDLGSLAHILYGVAAALLHAEYLFTTIFLVKQLGDALLLKEDWAETSGDMVEYVVGLSAGLAFRYLAAAAVSVL